jgi:restriction endonuclease Mrr
LYHLTDPIIIVVHLVALAATERTAEDSAGRAWESIHQAVDAGVGIDDLESSIQADWQILKLAAAEEQWSANTDVPTEFWAVHSHFATVGNIARESILQVCSHVGDLLFKYLARRPEQFYNLTPFEFEQVIAELFVRFGFDVTLTARTRDNACDIVAIERRISRQMLLIECKRYAPQNKVGIGPVQRLHGLVQGYGANKGIIATTSWFSSPATTWLEKHEWLLEGRDFNGLVDWLRQYQNRVTSA